ncbi:MAG: NADH-quinone oxidoreductase subunit J [Gammaproteobacteria bacterium]|jgi:formate hydrogenlyase subunit 3/multisubunit Na+/H+ antiporter MnhD subunit|nr:NADH-quinone oxidoreductase subunit J [Gammaproteobacteria bacterium]MBT4606602.1 NADH-quinone oxidoreductase subunit J [Thiotrichales bacterium]MBT3471496.1 NADH-quinone oxidoreductase subunit J [Gammaproteobacteria bacterium]MBT3966157.1 NADH-quinone oxidoreductase subunit J [Gammaproteobacteria bacterium]MBT4079250.1 NADH-quinone oxidoreductase subunit J [Gammaproteobacteria bacterium]
MHAENLALLVALPLLTAFLLQPLSQKFAVGWLAPLTVLVTLLLTLQLGAGVMEQPISSVMGGFVVPMGINFYLDGLAWLFLIALQLSLLLLWPRGEQGQSVRVQVLMLLLTASSIGLLLSGDLFNLYVFYELLAVATFGLVAAGESRATAIISFRYLLLSGVGSVLALTGIALLYSHAGTLNLGHLAELVASGELVLPLSAFLLMLLGFGVKAELFAVNGWVPEVYATLSPRLSALLAGVVSKLALIVIVRLLVLLFPTPEASQVLLLLGVLGVLSGELAAWRAQDLRRMLAYSSMGQLGVIFIAFSLSVEAGLLVGIMLSLHHLLVKPGLFLLTEQRFQGWSMVLFILFALSLVGVPPLPGFWAKFALLTGLVSAGGWINSTALVVFLFATVVEASYLFRVVQHYHQERERHQERGRAAVSVVGQDNSGVWISTLFATGLLLTAWQIQPISDYLQQLAVQAGDRQQLSAIVVGVTEGRP